MKTKTDEFEVLVHDDPQHPDNVHRFKVQIPLAWDDSQESWVMTEEAHRIIDKTVAEHDYHHGVSSAAA
ncbi:MAG: hypothetical protein ACAI35_12705 [Candidatus Methylacidiphilales bacterium]|nr:hypothetical protein [Candidatus Methylacidiphilales bacterium]